MESSRRKNPSKTLQTSLHVAMGLIYIVVGALVIVRQWFLVELQPLAAWSMGIVIILYGALRFYRGYNLYLEE